VVKKGLLYLLADPFGSRNTGVGQRLVDVERHAVEPLFGLLTLTLLILFDGRQEIVQCITRTGLPVLIAFLHDACSSSHLNKKRIVTLLIRGFLDTLDQVDHLGAVPTPRLFDQLNRARAYLDAITDLFDAVGIHMFPDQRIGLLLKILIDVHLARVSLSHDGIHRRQAAVVIDKRSQELVRRDDLVEHLDLLVFLEKLLAPGGIAEVLDKVVDVLVVEVLLDERQILRRFLLHLVLEQQLEQLQILDDGVHLFAVEGQRFLQLVEDADEIENEAVRFHHLLGLVLIGAVHPGDGLQQGMVAHRFVEIHGIEHGSVETGEQFLGDDENLGLLVELAEALADLPLLLRVEVEFLEQGGVVVVAGIDDLGIRGRQELIEGLLVVGAGLAVNADEKTLVAKRLDVLAEVVGDELRHLLDALLALEEVFQVHRPLENLVQLLDVGHALSFGKREKLGIQRLVGHQHLIWRKLVVKRQRGAVLDAVGNGILVQVALIVFAAEGLEGSLAVDGLVHRGAGKANVGGVRQAGHEEVAEVAAGGAVGLVDEDVDVRAGVEIRRHVAELVDHRHDDAPVIVLQKLVEPGDAGGMFQIAQAERGKVLEHLVFQLVAVDHQQHGRLVGRLLAKKPLRRLDHGKRLATALGVPDQPAGALRLQGAPDGGIHRAGLMLAQDVFVQLLILLGKDDVVLEKGEHPRDGAEALDLGLQLANLRVLPVENIAPHGVPAHPVGKADGIGGGEKLLRDEELGRLAVVTADLIHPEGNGLVLVGVLALDHQHRDAVDQKDDILPRAVVAVVKGPLLGDLVNVFRRVVVIDQDQVALALLLVVEELAPVTQVLDEVPVAVNIAVEMAELPEQAPPASV
jgi:hypothetical protein